MLTTDLSYGLDTLDEANINHNPSAGQTENHPPLQGAACLDVRRDVQGLTVPEVIDWGALLTLHVVSYVVVNTAVNKNR